MHLCSSSRRRCQALRQKNSRIDTLQYGRQQRGFICGRAGCPAATAAAALLCGCAYAGEALSNLQVAEEFNKQEEEEELEGMKHFP